MKASVPSLTLNGFITNKRMIFYKLWEYFLASDYSQTVIFNGGIASVKYLIGENSMSPVDIVEKTRGMLTSLYKDYFDVVNVEALILNPNDAYQILSISIMAFDNENPDVIYDLHKDIQNTKGEILGYEQLLSELYTHYK